MNILLLNPKSPVTLESLSEGMRWFQVESRVAPLELAILVGATPEGHSLTVVDQQAGDALDFQAEVDLVVCTARADQVPPLRYLSGRFRARKVPVVLVGSWVSEAAAQAANDPKASEATPFPGLVERTDMVDIRLVGPIETVWPLFLKSYQRDSRQKVWVGPEIDTLTGISTPHWEQLSLKRYLTGTVEAAREVLVMDDSTRGASEAVPGSDAASFQPTALRSVLYKGIGQVIAELESQVALGVSRFYLQAPDLLASPHQAMPLLDALRDLNHRHHKKLKFETCISVRSSSEGALIDKLADANVRRVVLTLNRSDAQRPDSHAELQAASEAVRTLLERGIRVSARLAVGRSCDDEPTLAAQEALLRESGALPWPRVAKAQTGSALYQKLKSAGRIVMGPRDADLKWDLLESPNFSLTFLDKDAFVSRLKLLLEALYAPTAQEARLRALYEEARRSPDGAFLPTQAELRALAAMLMGNFKHLDERRLEQVGRALALTAALRPNPRLWSQALELVIEDAATRSFVLKSLGGRPLDQTVPVLSWKQRALGLGASVVGRFGPRKAETSEAGSGT